MATASELKTRISSISETKKVTDAMYMISSVKLRKAKKEVENTKPYFNALTEQISDLIKYIPPLKSRYFRTELPEGALHGRHGILLVSSDKGLAGAYNNTAIKVVEDYMRRHSETVLFIIGEYARQYFSSRKIKFVEEFEYSADFPTVDESNRICADLLEYFDNNRLEEINIVYTANKGVQSSECKRVCLLPLEKSSFYNHNSQKNETFKEFYPNAESLLKDIIPSYLTGFIYSSLVDSFCSEQQARMSAMSTAGKNAEEMLKKLKMQYNGIRQAAITREMTEITAGAKALKNKNS